jgi:N-acetylmuramoyl-L-alanine amidase
MSDVRLVALRFVLLGTKIVWGIFTSSAICRSVHAQACAALLCLCFSVTLALAETAPLTSSHASLNVEGEVARLSFDLSAPVEAKSYILSDPDRIIIDLPEIAFQFPALVPAVRKGKSSKDRKLSALGGVIAHYRFGSFAQGRSRIVIDLTGPAKINHIESHATETGARLVIELAPTDRAHFLADAQKGRVQLAAQTPSPLAPLPQSTTQPRPVVVIDAGHGGIDSGALSNNGVNEKDIVFAFATRLAARLETSGKYKVVMTRNTDVFVPLNERVRIARAANAALFLSIHADTLSDDLGVTGATIYTVSDRASDAEAARVAEKENQADLAGGLDRREDQGEVNDILFDLTRRETRSYSHIFADNLIQSFQKVARLNKNPHRAAGFVVLKAPDVPSVLLELGYLSSDQDIASLTQPAWRDKATLAVMAAIDRFMMARIIRTEPEGSPHAVLNGLGRENDGN